MRFLVPFVVLGTFFLVGDASLNEGRATHELTHAVVRAKNWAVDGADRMADTFMGFHG